MVAIPRVIVTSSRSHSLMTEGWTKVARVGLVLVSTAGRAHPNISIDPDEVPEPGRIEVVAILVSANQWQPRLCLHYQVDHQDLDVSDKPLSTLFLPRSAILGTFASK